MATEYIEKQAAIDALKQLPHEYKTKEQRARTGGIAACQVVVRGIASADVRPVVRSRWEEVEVTWLADVEDQPDAIASMFCPECRRFANHVYHYGDPRYGMDFCPHCGARMGGDAEWESTSSTTPE